MAKVMACDCCGSTRNVYLFCLTPTGFDSAPVAIAAGRADICESCIVVLRFKWSELKGTKKAVANGR